MTARKRDWCCTDAEEAHAARVAAAKAEREPGVFVVREGRNYFATTPQCDNWSACQDLVRAGYMTARAGHPDIYGDMTFFHVTDAGRAALAEGGTDGR